MAHYRIEPTGRPLRGEVSVPGDKSVGHRSLIFASLAEGQSTIQGLSEGLDNVATAEIFRAMGVEIQRQGTTAQVAGVGLHGLRRPEAPLDCGNSGTGMRLLAGLLVGQKFGSRLVGDASLSSRPMARIIDPLRARGALISGTEQGGQPHRPPLNIAPLVDDEVLHGLQYDMPVASAQVKSALLLSGLYASGPTALREPVLSRDHTERMMLALGIPMETAGTMTVLDPEKITPWGGFEWTVPGDYSSAAFLLAAALVVPGSQVRVTGVGVNPTRTGFGDVLRALGAHIQQVPKGDQSGHEPVADLHVTATALRPAQVGGELLTRMIDEVPVFCAMAAHADGASEIRDAAELRVKESDRIAAMARVLRAFGVDCEEWEDGMRVRGAVQLKGAEVESLGDHRIAMSAAIVALCAEGTSIVHDTDCVRTSFPTFVPLMNQLGANIVEVHD